MIGTKWRHKKRGGIYTVIALAPLQTDHPSEHLNDMTVMVVYQGEDLVVWVRSEAEFMDGRFEKLR